MEIKLTAYQAQLLKECFEAETLELEPALTIRRTMHLKPLLRHGLIIPGNYWKNGKRVLRFYITPTGIKYLEL